MTSEDHPPITRPRVDWGRVPETDAESARAGARIGARLVRAQVDADAEFAARVWRRLVTEHPEAEILVLDREPAPVPPPPHRALVGIVSLLALLAVSAGIGLAFLLGRAAWCALAGCQ